MAKAPTKKSRMFALAGASVVIAALVLDAWFSPPLPPISTPIFGLVVVMLMQLAKQTREADGVQIPDVVTKESASIANSEVLLSIICGLGVLASLGMSGVSKQYERVAVVATLCFFAFTAVVFRFTRARFDALMRAAGVDPAGR
jgi:hypothetical protein